MVTCLYTTDSHIDAWRVHLACLTENILAWVERSEIRDLAGGSFPELQPGYGFLIRVKKED